MPGRSISRILSIGRVCRSTVSEGMIISLGRTLPSGSCNLPGTDRKTSSFPPPEGWLRPCLVLLPVGDAWPPYYYGRRWSFTPPFHPCSCERYLFCGPIRQVLPEGILAPGVTRHRCSMECGLSSKRGNAPRPSNLPDAFIIIVSGWIVNYIPGNCKQSLYFYYFHK